MWFINERSWGGVRALWKRGVSKKAISLSRFEAAWLLEGLQERESSLMHRRFNARRTLTRY
jgi:hypothetical protein